MTIRYLIILILSTVLAFNIVGVSAQDDLIPITASNATQVQLLGAIYRGFCPSCQTIEFSADSSTLTLGVGREVHVFNNTTFSERVALEVDEYIEYAASNHDGSVIATFETPTTLRVAFGKEGTLHLTNMVTDEDQALELSRSVFIVSPDGHLLAHSRPEGIIVRDFDTGEIFAELEHEDSMGIPLAFSADSTMLVYDLRSSNGDLSGLTSSIWIWDLQNGARQIEDTIEIRGYNNLALATAVFSEDNTILVVGRDDVRVWDLGTGDLVLTLPNGDVPFNHIPLPIYAFDTAQKYLAARGSENTIEIWDTTTGQLMQTVEMDGSEIRLLAFNPEGTTLVSTSWNEIWIWDVITGEHIAQINDMSRNVVADITFSLDSNVMMVSTGYGYSRHIGDEIRLYNARNGELISVMPEQTSNVLTLSLSPDGATLIAVSQDFLMWYGIPTDERLASGAIIAQANEEYINLRNAPSVEAEIIGRVTGNILITGRDESGEFVYLASHNGWVRAGSDYINTNGVPIEQLPVINP